MIYVYILKSEKDQKHYIGITGNVAERLKRHNMGGVRSTKNRAPFVLIKTEVYNSYLEARDREKEIKSYKGGIEFKKLIEN